MNLLHANDARGEHAPSWYAASCDPPRRAALERQVESDVCVIGGGYTGLAAAGELARRGHAVVLLEAHRIGWGASGRNGGQLGSGFNASQETLERRLGRERARGLWHIAEEAKATIRALGARHELHWRDGVVIACHRARALPRILRRAEHLAREYGYDAFEPLDRRALDTHLASAAYHGGVLDRGAAHLHPLRLAAALAAEAESAGARLYEGSEALRIENVDAATLAAAGRSSPSERALAPLGDGALPDRAPRVVTALGSVRAERLVIACNGYLGVLEPLAAGMLMPINNYVVATEPLGARAERLLPTDHAIADTRFIVRYFRRTADGRLLFGGGESYGYRFPPDIARRVRPKLLEVFPELADAAIEHAWGGTLAITPTRLPWIAARSPRVLLAGGYSGHGVGLAVAAGGAIARALDGETERLALLAALPTGGSFPGGARWRPLLLAGAMSAASWLDRV